MGENFAGVIEMSLVFGSVLLIAVVELVSLRRSKRRDEQRERQEESDREQP